MKRCAAFALLACCLALLLPACASHKGRRAKPPAPEGDFHEDTEDVSSVDFDARQREYVKRRDAAEDRHGLTLVKAQEKALSLSPGMTDKAVKDLLDLPDETTVEPQDKQGSAPEPPTSAQPARTLVWTYRWHWPTLGSAALEIRFRQAQNAWVLHSWRWMDK